MRREVKITVGELEVKAWRKEYNHLRPHSSLGYRPPAAEAIMPSYQAVGLTLEVVQ